VGYIKNSKHIHLSVTLTAFFAFYNACHQTNDANSLSSSSSSEEKVTFIASIFLERWTCH